MDLENIGNKTEDWAREHPERVFIAKSLLLLAILIIIKYIFREIYIIALILIPLFFVGWVVLNAFATGTSIWKAFKSYVTFIDVPRDASKDRIKSHSYVTMILIFLNIFIFLFIEQAIPIGYMLDNFAYPPREPTWWNVPVSMFTSMFLHSGFDHIFYNMMFLAMIGSIVEKRIGSRRYFICYMACGLMANAVAGIAESMFASKLVPGIGASGAISGVMGLYMVRCYYRDMQFPIASLGLFHVNVRINSFIVMGIYFASDVRGGIRNILTSQFYGTGHFCHLGGVLSGIAIAYALKLHKDAIEERHRSLLSDLTDDSFDYGLYEEIGGLAGAKEHAEHALSLDSNNPETYLALARIKARTDTYAVGTMHKKVGEGKEYFEKALDLMVASGHEDTVKVFMEYFKEYGEILVNDAQLGISIEIYRLGNYNVALNTLELLIASKRLNEERLEKAMFYSALCSEKLELYEHASFLFKDLLYRFPKSKYKENIIDKTVMLSRLVREQKKTADEPVDLEKIGLIKSLTAEDNEQISQTFNWGACLSPAAWSYMHGCNELFYISLGVRVGAMIMCNLFFNILFTLILFWYIGHTANNSAISNAVWSSKEEYKEESKKFFIRSLILFTLFEPLYFLIVFLR